MELTVNESLVFAENTGETVMIMYCNNWSIFRMFVKPQSSQYKPQNGLWIINQIYIVFLVNQLHCKHFGHIKVNQKDGKDVYSAFGKIRITLFLE